MARMAFGREILFYQLLIIANVVFRLVFRGQSAEVHFRSSLFVLEMLGCVSFLYPFSSASTRRLSTRDSADRIGSLMGRLSASWSRHTILYTFGPLHWYFNLLRRPGSSIPGSMFASIFAIGLFLALSVQESPAISGSWR